MIIPYQFGYCNIWGSIISGSTLSAKLTNDAKMEITHYHVRFMSLRIKNIIVILSLQHKMSILCCSKYYQNLENRINRYLLLL